MKRILSLILAALMLVSSMASCGKTEPAETSASETKAPETKVTETNAPETDSPETTALAPSYDPALITENGVAKSHIVLFDGAADFEKTAADELAYHLKLVTGADVAVTNGVQSDSLPIIIATPDSLPELETLFPEDLAWLRVTSEKGENGRTHRFGDDGFAVRQHDGKIYIFGATALGALNGTYDFIEENLDVIWVNSTESGIIYDEMPTAKVLNADYREKSPFYASTPYSYSESTYLQRNKHFVTDYLALGDATVKSLLLSSPTYDPNIDEYWDTDADGNHLSPSDSKVWYDNVSAQESKQINFWSQLTADTVGESVIAYLDFFSDAERPHFVNVCMEDIYSPYVYPEISEPFEYAPGQFVEPGDSLYITTVYFTFINRVARKVAEKYPDVYINTLAYMWAVRPPKCELEPNVSIWFAPIDANFTDDSYLMTAADTESSHPSVQIAKAMIEWSEYNKDNPMIFYNYYFWQFAQGWYERPLWHRIGNDFQYLADMGYIGSTICGNPAEGSDSLTSWQAAFTSPDYQARFTGDEGFKMNLMSQWIYYKLLWNPYEDVDALIVEFCDKVYGDASPYMQEYYDLLELGWAEGGEAMKEEFNITTEVESNAYFYYFYFLDFDLDDGTYYLDAIRDVLTKAYEAADDKAKTFIEWPYEVYQDWTRFLQ